MDKVYLGDGVYVEHDGYNIILTVHDGICEAQRIYLEPQVLDNFQLYLKGRPKDEEEIHGS